MKKINIILLVFFCLSINYPILSASNNLSKLDSMRYHLRLLDSNVKKNEASIGALNNKTSDAELFRKLESLEKDIYDRDHKLTMNYVNFLLIIVTVLFTIAFFLFGYSIYFSSKKWKDELDNKIKDFVEKTEIELDNKMKVLSDEANEKLTLATSEIEDRINETKTSFYYQFGLKFFNEKKYAISIDFFIPLYNSDYRHSEVCFYLAQSYFNLKDYNNVLDYIKESLDSTQDDIKAYGIFSFLNSILNLNNLSINFKSDICSFIQEMNKNPKEYFQKNTKELIKKIENDFCNNKENYV